jgi:hypothetical protein
MKERSHSNLKFVTTGILEKKDMNKHVTSIHEGNKPFKCDISDYSARWSDKRNMNTHFASVHEVKKPFKCDICDYCCSKKHKMKQHVEKRRNEEKFEMYIFKYSLTKFSAQNKIGFPT